MSEPFLSEIKLCAWDFAPKGFADCRGQILSISQNTALFSLLLTNYGGDGTSTFGLPNLAGRAPLHPGTGPGLTQRDLGEMGGSENVTLTTAEMPAHAHPALGDAAAGGQASPGNNTWGRKAARTPAALYSSGSANASMNPLSIAPAGSGQPHNNLAPYLTIRFVIALEGIFPS